MRKRAGELARAGNVAIMAAILGGVGYATLGGRQASAIGRRQADVRVTSITSTVSAGQFRCDVQVTSDNDAAAQGTTVTVLLPLDITEVVGVLGPTGGSVPDSCALCAVPGSLPDDPHGLVVCELGQLAVGAQRTVRVTGKVPATGIQGACAAFASSRTPDPNPGNNFAQAAGGSSAPALRRR